ncbi:MAG TPA: hypothetical protein VE954_00740 [Oligoflexus sp.]|uniref:hypothetical protein n=1 Tax=Oligoflexus sp. TaxID=1971216 RepID=UPI002D6806DE|nr:hypothetical protein [Oligoflexus sp.]HYX31606.1 hypothetical protein [Oligoflexus sp.]
MNKSSFLLGIAVIFISCSDSKSSKTDPIVPEVVPQAVAPQDETSGSNPVPTPTATPVPTGSDRSEPVKIKKTFSLFTLPAADAGLARSAAKVISLTIKPLKVTSFAGIKGSFLSANCGSSVITKSKVILLTDDDELAPTFHPAIVIPADVLCSEEIKVNLDVYGFDVELGDVLVADVVSVGKPAIIQ